MNKCNNIKVNELILYFIATSQLSRSYFRSHCQLFTRHIEKSPSASICWNVGQCWHITNCV